jgi:serine/threonine protein kinase
MYFYVILVIIVIISFVSIVVSRSPELFEGHAYSFASDVYALGLLLHEIWCGEIPFDGASVDDIRRKFNKGEMPKINTTKLPREIVKIIQECIDKDPKKRPTIEKVMQMIKAYQC